jgi:hypothetical protein
MFGSDNKSFFFLFIFYNKFNAFYSKQCFSIREECNQIDVRQGLGHKIAMSLQENKQLLLYYLP